MSHRYNIGYLLTTTSEVYRCVNSSMVIVSGFAINTHASSSRQIYIQHVPADATPDDKFSLYHEQNISSKSSLIIDDPVILSPGESIYAKASAGGEVALTLYIVPYADWIASGS